jgi:hypothetical protein
MSVVLQYVVRTKVFKPNVSKLGQKYRTMTRTSAAETTAVRKGELILNTSFEFDLTKEQRNTRLESSAGKKSSIT